MSIIGLKSSWYLWTCPAVSCQKSQQPNFWKAMGCFVSTNRKWFLWVMTAAQAAKNQGNEWGLTWYLQWGIYT